MRSQPSCRCRSSACPSPSTSSSRPSDSEPSGLISRTSGATARCTAWSAPATCASRRLAAASGRAARRRDAAGRTQAARRGVRPRRLLRVGAQGPGAAAADEGAGRLPAAARARPVRDPRHLDHRAAGLALRRLRDPQPVDRALRRRVGRAYTFPTAKQLSPRERGRPPRARLLAAQGGVRARARAGAARPERAGLPPRRGGEAAPRRDPRHRRVDRGVVPGAAPRPSARVAGRRRGAGQGRAAFYPEAEDMRRARPALRPVPESDGALPADWARLRRRDRARSHP